MHTQSGLLGPLPLTDAAIAQHIPKGAPGVYALGFVTGGVFTVVAIGRGDASLSARLAELAGERRYPSFKYAATGSAHDAFDLECQLFHQFGGSRHLENGAHPEQPDGSRWLCPHCAYFGIREWAMLAR